MTKKEKQRQASVKSSNSTPSPNTQNSSYAQAESVQLERIISKRDYKVHLYEERLDIGGN